MTHDWLDFLATSRRDAEAGLARAAERLAHADCGREVDTSRPGDRRGFGAPKPDDVPYSTPADRKDAPPW